MTLAQGAGRHRRWALPLRISAVSTVALLCVVLSVWGFSTVQASAVPAAHETPAWVVDGWDAVVGWTAAALP